MESNVRVTQQIETLFSHLTKALVTLLLAGLDDERAQLHHLVPLPLFVQIPSVVVALREEGLLEIGEEGVLTESLAAIGRSCRPLL